MFDLKINILMLVLFCFVCCGCDNYKQEENNAKNNYTMKNDKIINVANVVAKANGFSLEDTTIIYDNNNEWWLKKFEHIRVGISISTLDDILAKKLEPGASKPSDRIQAIKTLYNNKISTYVFISPFFPEITNFREIIERTINISDYYMFDNLNFRPHNIPRILKVIKEYDSKLLPLYQEFRTDRTRWDVIEDDIRKYCEKKQLNYHIVFHHGGFSKS